MHGSLLGLRRRLDLLAGLLIGLLMGNNRRHNTHSLAFLGRTLLRWHVFNHRDLHLLTAPEPGSIEIGGGGDERDERDTVRRRCIVPQINPMRCADANMILVL